VFAQFARAGVSTLRSHPFMKSPWKPGAFVSRMKNEK